MTMYVLSSTTMNIPKHIRVPQIAPSVWACGWNQCNETLQAVK